MSSSLGLKLSLSPKLAASLRESAPEQETSAAEQEQDNNEQSNDDKEVPKVALELDPRDNHGQSNDEKEVPKISIDLERLVGYQPEPEEIESIKFQLLSAMWTRYRLEEREETESSSSETPQEPPPDFDFQVVDLLENGVASFSQPTDHSSTLEENKNLIISYPTTIIASDGQAKSTPKMWKDASTYPSSSVGKEHTAFLPRLWKYLTYCSHNLDWKYQMSLELGNLVEEEQGRLDYYQWTSTQRKAKLDQLYSIRETIVHQVDLSKEKYDSFVNEREILVKQEFQQHQRQAAVGSSELTFPDKFALLGLDDRFAPDQDDWGSDDDSYMHSDGSSDSNLSDDGYATDASLSNGEQDADSFPVGIMDQDALEDGNESGNDDNVPATSVKNENAVHDELTADAGQEPNTTLTTDEKTSDQPSTSQSLILPFQKRKERQIRAKRRKRIERKEAKRRAEKERLQKLKQEIREKHTSKDMIIAQTMYEALSKKVENVDELLESLQDEEWQAEEEQENEGKSANPADKANEESFSLLDQILAMILGATPIQRNMSPKEHYQFVQEEHRSIVSDWKSYFGRLPSSVGSGAGGAPDIGDTKEKQEMPSPSQLRLQLGITDNIDEDWDAEDDWEDSVDNHATNRKSQEAKPVNKPSIPEPTKPKVVGLRPGGRIER
jgi:hypothetical protein